MSAKKKNGLSNDAKTIITVLLLIFAYPAGLILTFLWMKDWPKWLKVLVSLPLFLLLFTLIMGMILIFSPGDQVKRVEETRIRYEEINDELEKFSEELETKTY